MLAMTIERRLQSKGVRIEITYRGVVGRSGTVDLNTKADPALQHQQPIRWQTGIIRLRMLWTVKQFKQHLGMIRDYQKILTWSQTNWTNQKEVEPFWLIGIVYLAYLELCHWYVFLSYSLFCCLFFFLPYYGEQEYVLSSVERGISTLYVMLCYDVIQHSWCLKIFILKRAIGEYTQ